MTYKIVATPDRVSALDRRGIEICGAFKPEGHNYWQLFTTQLVTAATGLRCPAHREHFFGDHGAEHSRAWVELIAALYYSQPPAEVMTA